MGHEQGEPESSPLVTRHLSLVPDFEPIARLLSDPHPEGTRGARLVEWLSEPLGRCADPAMALANLTRWASHLVSARATFATLEEDPRLLDDLLCLFSSSQYLADILIREPTAYTLLREPDAAWESEDLKARIAGVAAPFSRPESRLEALRRARRREFLRIGWRDLCGRASFEAVVRKISELAEALIQQTLATVRAPLAERQPELDAQVRFAVVAMGKLGGGELNYSSDVDLLFMYDSPAPDDAAHLRYATRLGEALFSALSATTAEGALFRVDMRLRPEGRYGALVRSLASYREYYDRWIETWERQALIKARPVAGDEELGRRFAALAQERAYPTVHATTLFEDVRDMRAAIGRKVESRQQSDTNVKEGRGTIREIEFTVQLLQLLFGAQRPEVRTGTTLEALARLETAGLLTAQERERFADHYRFFRAVEHRLQIMDDLPVRVLPDDPAELRKLGLRMGFSHVDADGFLTAYHARTEEVQRLSRGILDRLTVDGVAAADPLRLMIMGLGPQSGGGEAQPAALQERLAAMGFRQPETAVDQLRGLATGAPKFSLPVSTTRLFADLAAPLLEAAAAAPDPDGALSAVAAVAERLGTHRTFYQTLRQQPDMRRALCQIVGFSPAVREMVLRSPEYLDVLYDEPFRELPRAAEDMRADMVERLQRAFSPADRLVALRRFQKRELLRLIARDLLIGVDAETTAADLSDLADVCVAGALEVVGLPVGFAVFALGRLGGRDLHYLSDLDLLYVYDPPPGVEGGHRQYEQLASELTRALKEWMREGQLYDVDLRLRPEGKSGFVAVHLEAAQRYYLGGRAQTWERQALTKARPVAGDPDLATRFLEAVRPFVYGQGLSGEADGELRAMKRRIETERVSVEERRRHLKLGPGGLTDIEFLAQRLQLAYGHKHAALRDPSTFAALRAASDLGLLPEEAVRELLDGFTFLTLLRQRLRLRSAGTPTDLLPEDPAEQEVLARSLGLSDGATLMERCRAITTRVRELFTGYFREN